MFGFGPKVPSVNAEDLKKALDDNGNITILDVRTAGEFSKGKIRGSINLPLDDLSGKIGKIISDKNKTIYVYCLSGSRSVFAVDTMIKLGYTNVCDVKNGLLAWRFKKYPIED